MTFRNLNSITVLLGLLTLTFLFACGDGDDVHHAADEEHMHEASHDGDDGHHMADGAHMHEESGHSDHGHAEESMHGASGPVMMSFAAQTPAAFQEQLGRMAQSYQELKDALVKTDFEAAQSAASEALGALQGVDMTQLQGEAHSYWMQQQQPMQQHLRAMANASEVEELRQHFAELTEPMKNSISAYGVPGTTFYVQYCPMAFDNQGASWISDEETILNPYFGDKMLKCGTVKETLTTN